ncbi:MAG: hypothetical protein A4E53_03371 [Pelotomaculum sp. PtaB.Bin104]|nr:MAG: hypothetical protein A4E53_03371 [Pelotomaculum sp. PtaB.Bin104]
MPTALLPEPGNLKAVFIDLGVPQGQKAEPGAEYTATLVVENISDRAYPGTPVAVLHGEYQATLYDESGRVLPKKTIGGKEGQVADFDKKGTPGAKRTFKCKWHPFAQAKDGLTGMVNRDEIGKVHLETTYDDNVVSAQVNVNAVNLKAVSIDPGVSGEADPGGEYTGHVTFANESDYTFTGVPVGVIQNNQQLLTLYDEQGNELPWQEFPSGKHCQVADFSPYQIRTFIFK